MSDKADKRERLARHLAIEVILNPKANILVATETDTEAKLLFARVRELLAMMV